MEQNGSEQRGSVDLLKDFYVYELFDRETGEVFYVGEGVRERAYDHLNESERIRKKLEKDPTLAGSILSEKVEKINALRSDRHDRIGVRVVARFESKEQALAVESVLINWIYGAETLTNISKGHGSRFVRPKAKATDELPGIDIPKQMRVLGAKKESAGVGYLKDLIDAHQRHGHAEMAEGIAEHIRLSFPALQIDPPVFWESGRYVAVFVPLVPDRVRMLIQVTASGKHQHVYNLKPVSESKADIAKFVAFLSDEYPSLSLRNNGKYTKLPDWEDREFSNGDLGAIMDQVQYALSYFNR